MFNRRIAVMMLAVAATFAGPSAFAETEPAGPSGADGGQTKVTADLGHQSFPASVAAVLAKRPELPVGLMQQLPIDDFRFVYCGSHGTYHVTYRLGTARSLLPGYETLVGLKYSATTSDYYIYTVDEHGLENEMWAFGRVEYSCGGFPVWRRADYNRDGNLEWRIVDWAERSVPGLPRD